VQNLIIFINIIHW